jgi:hypothetical protein
MIIITKSETADTRTCDVTKVSKGQLKKASHSHIADVRQALALFQAELARAAREHDHTKLDGIDQFHDDFKTGFKITSWWDNHRKVERHHLLQEDGVKADVDLIDVLEFIADCVMAGMARSGSVYKLELPDALLQRAFQNTVDKLKNRIVIDHEAGA